VLCDNQLSEVYTISIFKVDYRNINIRHMKYQKYSNLFHVVARIADFILSANYEFLTDRRWKCKASRMLGYFGSYKY